MNWKREFVNYMPSLRGGDNQYKVIRYGENWFAFFKPSGWANFGNSCAITRYNGKSVEYKSMREAMAACERHLAEFGDNPNMNDRIAA